MKEHLAGEYKRLFEQRVRKRGEAYFLGGAVRDADVDRNVATATVHGKGTYTVSIRFYPDHTPELNCSCAYFNAWGDNCKHLWALFLYVESLIAEGEIGYDQLFVKGGAGRVPQWSAFKELVKPVIEKPVEAKGQAGFQLFYGLDAKTSIRRRQFTFIVRERYRKLSGAWGRHRDFTGEIASDTIVTADDRRILSVLLGQAQLFGARFQSRGFILTDEVCDYVLPLMERTGRLRLIRPDGETAPLNVDLASGWTFSAVVEPAADGYTLEGRWQVNGTACGAAEIAMLSGGERLWMLREATLLCKERDAGSGWEQILFRDGRIAVSATELIDFASYYNTHQSAMPPVILPEDLRFEEVPIEGVHPLAYLSFSHTKFWTEAAFLYNDRYEFSGLNDSAWFIDTARKVRLQRDRKREEHFLENLAVAGFTRTGNWFHCDPEAVCNAVEALESQGWQIFGENRKTRIASPTQMSINVRTGIDWFELDGAIEYNGARVPLGRVIDALAKGAKFVPLGQGAVGLLPEDWLSRYQDVFKLAAKENVKDEKGEPDTYRIGRAQFGMLDQFDGDTRVHFDRAGREFRRRIRDFAGIEAAEPAPGFAGELRGYQKLGVGWLEFLDEYGFGGCLGDDMGLGKTVQVLAYLQRRKKKHRGLKALIVVPASIVFNWIAEAERFTPDLKVLPFWGGDRKRAWKKQGQCDLILTSYATMVRDAELLCAEEFDCIIFDEAQQLKNPWAKRTRAARKLKAHIKISLTGTPLENHLGDLWSQFSVINPGLFGGLRQFKERFVIQGNLDLLRRLIQPFVLRRTKAEVLSDLPPKVEETLFCEMTAEQRIFYDEVRGAFRDRILDKVARDGINASRMNVLEGLLRLRQICCYPGLVDRRRSADSGKLASLKGMVLQVIEEGHKALIFSQFVQMLAHIREWVEEQGISYAYLDGKTADRQAPVALFQNNPSVKLFLISLKAGGVGLNLTAADYVFLYDPWWNPAVETQAIDRTHRIGQTNTVFTYRFITRESIEEKIQLLQERKQSLIGQIVDAAARPLSELTAEDIAFLFS